MYIHDQSVDDYKIEQEISRRTYLINQVLYFRKKIAETLQIENKLIVSENPKFNGLPYLFIDLNRDGVEKKFNEINAEDKCDVKLDYLCIQYYVDYAIKLYKYGKLISIPYRTSLFCNKWVIEDDYKIPQEEIMIQAKVFKQDGFVEELVLRCVAEIEYKKEIYKAVDNFIRRVKEEIEIS